MAPTPVLIRHARASAVYVRLLGLEMTKLDVYEAVPMGWLREA
jgi:hypothetical protein